MLEKKILSIPLAAPLSQETSDKIVDPTQVVVEAENVIYTKNGEIAKAYGHNEFGAVTVTESDHTGSFAAEMGQLHFVANPKSDSIDDLVIAGSSETILGSHVLPGNYYVAGTPTNPATYQGTNRIFDVIGKMFPIEQDKFTVGSNRIAPHSADCAYSLANNMDVIWSAWIENGAVILACTKAGEDKYLSVPGAVTITNMTSDVLRVRILAVGSSIHVYASKLGSIRLATFASNYYAGAVASAVVDTTPTRAHAKCAGANMNTIIEATVDGYDGNGIITYIVGTSPAGVMIAVSNNVVSIRFEDGVSTAADIETAIGLLGPGEVVAQTNVTWTNGPSPNTTYITTTGDPLVFGVLGNSWSFGVSSVPGYGAIAMVDDPGLRTSILVFDPGLGYTVNDAEGAILTSPYVTVSVNAADGLALLDPLDEFPPKLLTGGEDVADTAIIAVTTPDTIGAAHLHDVVDNETLITWGYQDCWDAIKVTISGVDSSIIGYRNDVIATDVDAFTNSRFNEAGALASSANYTAAPAYAMALCTGYVSPIGLEGFFAVYQEEILDITGVPYHYNVMLSTHTFAAGLPRTNLDILYEMTDAGLNRLTSCTICDNQITEQTDGVSGLACFLEFARINDGIIVYDAPWDHTVLTLLVDPVDASAVDDVYPLFGYHRILSRSAQYHERAHVWLGYESDTAPVAELVSIGKNSTGTLGGRELETEAIWYRGTVVPSDSDYGPVLGSIVTHASEYYWPAVCAETQDTKVVRLSKYNYNAISRRVAKAGTSSIVGQGQLMGFSGSVVAPHGFAYPPEIIDIIPTYDEAQETYQLTGDSDYKYIAVYEWVDDNGEFHQSAPSIPKQTTIPPNPPPGLANLTITAGVNDQITIEADRYPWGGFSTTFTSTIPAGTYATFDELGLAMSKQLTADAVLAGLGGGTDFSYAFFCFMTTPPVSYSYTIPASRTSYRGDNGRVLQYETPAKYVSMSLEGIAENVQVISADRFHIYLYCPSGAFRILNVIFGGGINSIGPSLGFTGDRDIETAKSYTEKREWDGDDGVYVSKYVGSWCLGDKTLVPEPTTTAGRCLVNVRPYVPGPFDINNNKIVVSLYRTQANGGAYTLVSKLSAYTPYTGSYVQFDDRASDESIQDAVPVYTTGEPGDVLENCPATPSGRAFAISGDRVWLVNEENRKEVFASLPKRVGFATEFSQFSVVPYPEEITALLPVDNYMVAFSKHAIYVVSGSGPNALGIGEFTIPALICSHAGADNEQSVVSAGDNSIFFSKEAGLWSISRGLQVQDITTQVEDVLGNGTYGVVASLFRPDEQRIEVYFDGDFGLYYDIRHKRWTKQTGFVDLTAACYTNYVTVHLKSGTNEKWCVQGNVYIRNGLTYSMKIKTGWIKVNGLMGFQRIWWESILGKYEDHHNLSVKRYLDYSTTVNNTKTAIITTDPGRYLLKSKPAQQKCSAVQYVIEDAPIAGDTSTEACKLTAIELVVGVKRTHTVRGKGF